MDVSDGGTRKRRTRLIRGTNASFTSYHDDLRAHHRERPQSQPKDSYMPSNIRHEYAMDAGQPAKVSNYAASNMQTRNKNVAQRPDMHIHSVEICRRSGGEKMKHGVIMKARQSSPLWTPSVVRMSGFRQMLEDSRSFVQPRAQRPARRRRWVSCSSSRIIFSRNIRYNHASDDIR